MLRVCGRKVWQFGIPIATLFLLASVAVYGQSLGDVARQTREKEAAATVPAKVITDGDLASGASETGQPAKAQTASQGKSRASGSTANPPDSHAAEQWRRQILAQKRIVETLEKRLARYQASLSSVDAAAISRGEILTRSQALEQERIAQVQEQLGEQRGKLLEMQEEARRAGMHTQVYDP
jgi:hypothetical protein